MTLPKKRKRFKRARLMSLLSTTVMYVLGGVGGVLTAHHFAKLARAEQLSVDQCSCGGFTVHIYSSNTPGKIITRSIEFHYHNGHDDDDGGDEADLPEEVEFIKPEDDAEVHYEYAMNNPYYPAEA